MDWFEVRTTDNKLHLVNTEAILDVSYNEEADLTTINFIRPTFAAMYINGNIYNDVKRLLNSHEHYVSRIGV